MISKVIKAGGYKIQESKPNVIDDDRRLKAISLSESRVLRCCYPIKAGNSVRIGSVDIPKGSIVKRVFYDPNRMGFTFLIWNMEFPVVEDFETPPNLDSSFEEHLYRITDQ